MNDDELQLISDGDGLAVIGDPELVDQFLKSEGLASADLGLGRLGPVLAKMSAATQAGGVLSENSGRWVELTKESAAAVKKYGPSMSKKNGLATGVVRKGNGQIAKHLQFLPSAGASVLNPAVLAGAGGIMAQLAMEQQMAEINDYLEQIDQKLDEVLQAQKDSVLSDLASVKYTLEEAIEIRNETGKVSAVTWSKVQTNSATIARTQDYAVRQLDALAEKLESESKVGAVAKAVKEIDASAREWLMVLAQAFKLQDAFGVLELERVMEDDPDSLDSHRLGLHNARTKRTDAIAETTRRLLERIHAAATLSNRDIVFNPIDARGIRETSNRVTGVITQFQETLGIEGEDVDSAESVRWRTALLGMRDEALDAGAEALDATRELGGKVRTDIEDRRYKRLSKRFDRMSQKRSEREQIKGQTESLEE